MNKEIKEKFMNTKNLMEANKIGEKYKLYQPDEDMLKHLKELFDKETTNKLDINKPIQFRKVK